jgi:TetR/AcrR family transcriptional regulator, lmrAB and yxaGH operons repressor
MARTSRQREAIVQTAVRLFRQQGFAATGLNQIVEDSGAPKGSLYHYFPAGKEAIGAAAVAQAGETVNATLLGLAQETRSPGELMRRFALLLAGWMHKSGFKDGCPIATTLLETAPESPSIRAAGEAAFDQWAAIFSKALEAEHVPPPRAHRLAWMAIAVIEGSLIQARVTVQQKPLLDAAEEVARAFDAAMLEARADLASHPEKPGKTV